MDTGMRNRSCRRRSFGTNHISYYEITFIVLHLTLLLSSYVTATTKYPVLTQRIGFAGELKEDDLTSSSSISKTNTESNGGSSKSSTSNNDDIKETSPLFEASSINNEQYYNNKNRHYPSQQKFHPNHRYPDQLALPYTSTENRNDNDRYYLTLKKQPTSSIISEAAYFPAVRRYEVGNHHRDEYEDSLKQQLQYGSRPHSTLSPSPSPTPIYRKVYRSSPAPKAEISYFTKKTGFDDVISTPLTPQPEPKKYAFEYAVRDGHRGDDYSHKESRDGKVTMGEYKVLLPDGRLQVVRYTADAKAGFKADVTYEGDENHQHHHHDPKYLAKPTEKPYVYSKAPYYNGPFSSASPSYVDSSASPTPTVITKYHKTPYQLNYPSVSPSIVYKATGASSNNNYPYIKNNNNRNSITPTPFGFLKSSPSPTTPSSIPKNIYEKINHNDNNSYPSKPYSPIPRGYPAGPTKSSIYANLPSSTPHYDEINPSPPSGVRKHRKISDAQPTSNYFSKDGSSTTSKSRLIPIEHFKAGPYTHSPKEYTKYLVSPTPTPSYYHSTPRPKYNSHEDNHRVLQHHNSHENHHNAPKFHSHEDRHTVPNHHSHEDHHYIVVQDHHHDHHDQVHQEIYPTLNYDRSGSPNEESKNNFPPVKSSLATFTSLLSGGGSTPKPALYIKSNPVIGVGRPIKPSIGGLVYLETPGRGIRPTAFGVKEILARLPHDNLPRPKTTTHPYQIGSKDYGDAVSYGTNSNNNKPFIPSEQIPNEYLLPNTDELYNSGNVKIIHHHHLIDDTNDNNNNHLPISRNFNDDSNHHQHHDNHNVLVSYKDNH